MMKSCLPVVIAISLSFHTRSVQSLSSVSLPTQHGRQSMLPSYSNQESPTLDSNNDDTMTVASPWRLVLDIGREPLSSMPFDWARSGCRMPLRINSDITSSGQVVPHQDTVSFTGPNGAVEVPIVGGEWKLSKDQRQVTMTMTFPQRFERRDVWIEAGTTIQLTGRIYAQTELDQLNQEFYDARETVWELGGQLNELADRQDAPKKWNEERQQWEKRYEKPNLANQLSKRWKLMTAQAVKQQKDSLRPDPQSLSTERGLFPGINDDRGVYIQKGGTISIPGAGGPLGNAILGTWSAEPNTNKPASYRNS